MMLKKRLIMRGTPNKAFKELEIPDKEFEGMNEGDKKLYCDDLDEIILEISNGKKFASFVIGHILFEE
jgi:hypothetical protein